MFNFWLFITSLVLCLLTFLHLFQLYSSSMNFVKALWPVHIDKLLKNCFNFVFYIRNLVLVVCFIHWSLAIAWFCHLEIKNRHRLQARYSKGNLSKCTNIYFRCLATAAVNVAVRFLFCSRHGMNFWLWWLHFDGVKCENARVRIGCTLKNPRWLKLIRSPPLRHAS